MASDYISARREIEACIDNVNRHKIFMLAFILAMGHVADAIQITSISYVMTEMKDLTTYHKVLLSSSVFIGMLLGGVLFGYMSDREGRRPCLLLALVMNFLGGFMAVCAPSGAVGVEYLVMCYIFSGIGIGGTLPITFTLGTELFPSDNRGQLLSGMASVWMLGNLFTSAAGWVFLGNDINGHKIMPPEVGNWRVFVVVCIVPILVTIFLTYVHVPESPLFLLVHGRYEAVNAFILKHNSIYGPDDSDVGVEGTTGNPIRAMEVSSEVDLNTLAQAGGAGAGASQRSIGLSGSTARYSNLEMTHVAGVEVSRSAVTGTGAPSGRRKTVRWSPSQYWCHAFLLAVVWTCLSFATFGIVLWVNTLFTSMRLMNIYAASFLFALGSLPGSAFAFTYIDRFGRKTILTGSLVASVAAGFAFTFSASLQLRALEAGSASEEQLLVNAMIVVSSMLFGAFTVSSWNALDILSAELFPASVRPTTLGVLAGFGRVGAIASQVVCGYLVYAENSIVELLLTVTVSTAVACLCSVCLPDTTGSYLGGHAEKEREWERQGGRGDDDGELDDRLDAMDDHAGPDVSVDDGGGDGDGEEEGLSGYHDPVSAISKSIKNLPAALAANMDIPLFVSPRSRNDSPNSASPQASGHVSYNSRRSDVSNASYNI